MNLICFKMTKRCPGLFDHTICIDNFLGTHNPRLGFKQIGPKFDKPCIVYDFGIREQPQFGVVMAGAVLGVFVCF